MIEKNELMQCLKNNFMFEEEIVRKLSDFYKALGWRRVVKQQYHSTIENALETLKKDSQIHVYMIEKMIQYVEGSNKNEF